MTKELIKRARELFEKACNPNRLSQFCVIEDDNRLHVVAVVKTKGQPLQGLDLAFYRQFAANLMHGSGHVSISEIQCYSPSQNEQTFIYDLPNRCPFAATCLHALDISDDVRKLEEEEQVQTETTATIEKSPVFA
jgi:hypothetical protein